MLFEYFMALKDLLKPPEALSDLSRPPSVPRRFLNNFQVIRKPLRVRENIIDRALNIARSRGSFRGSIISAQPLLITSLAYSPAE